MITTLASISLLIFTASALQEYPPRPTPPSKVYSDGSRGSVTGMADDFGATYHTSAFLLYQGCSHTGNVFEMVNIKHCYTASLAADPETQLETEDYKPYLAGGVGTRQRAMLLSAPHLNTSGVVTHKVLFHVSPNGPGVPLPGQEKAVTFVGLRNLNASIGLKALDVRARTFTGKGTSGPVLYVAVVAQNGTEDFPTSIPLSTVVGKTIEVTYKLGVNGATVDKSNKFVAEVTAKFDHNYGVGNTQLFKVTVSKRAYPKGVVDQEAHRLIFGANRKASTGQKVLTVWFGDYYASPHVTTSTTSSTTTATHTATTTAVTSTTTATTSATTAATSTTTTITSTTTAATSTTAN